MSESTPWFLEGGVFVGHCMSVSLDFSWGCFGEGIG